MEKEGPSGIQEGANRKRVLKRRQPVDDSEDELVSEVDEEESDNTHENGKKKGGTGSKGMFTFLLPTVIRILWFMLHEKKLDMKSSLDMRFYREWFAAIVTAASKVCRISDGRNGLDILWENCGKRWNYKDEDPPHSVYNSLKSIKVRESRKDSPLSPEAYSKDIISVAWNCTVCDSHGFAYEPTFRLPHPPCDSASVRDQPEQVQHVVAAIRPCSTCWSCSCGATQNLTWKSVRQETTIADVQGERDEAMKLCGYQYQVSAEHWDLSSAQLVKQCAIDRKKILQLEGQNEEKDVALQCAQAKIETLEKDVQKLTTTAQSLSQLEKLLSEVIKEKQDVEEKLKDATAKNSATDAALNMIGAFRNVCTSCRSCKRKCMGKGLMDD